MTPPRDDSYRFDQQEATGEKQRADPRFCNAQLPGATGTSMRGTTALGANNVRDVRSPRSPHRSRDSSPSLAICLISRQQSAGTRRVHQVGHPRARAGPSEHFQGDDLQEKRSRACPAVDACTAANLHGKEGPTSESVRRLAEHSNAEREEAPGLATASVRSRARVDPLRTFRPFSGQPQGKTELRDGSRRFKAQGS